MTAARNIVLAGIAARVLLLLIVDPAADWFSGDTVAYLTGPLGEKAPLYSLFLRALAPAGIWLPMTVQSALTIISGAAAAQFIGGKAGYRTGLLIVVCPFLAFADLKLLSESLYLNLLWLGWLLLYRGHWASGLLLGLAILTRSTLLLLPLFALPFLRSKRAMIAAAGAFLVVAPVAATVGLGHGYAGLNLWAGTWERNTAWYLPGVQKPAFPPYAFRSVAEEKLVRSTWMNDGVLKGIAVDRLKSEPVSVLKTWAARYPNLWLGTRSDYFEFRAERGSTIWKALKAGLYALNLLILAFGLWGLTKPNMFAVPVVYIAVVHIPFHAEWRYTMAAIPFLLALGCIRSQSVHEREAEQAPRSVA